MRRLWWLMALLGMLAGACGGDDASTSTDVGASDVRPFEEIQGSDLVWEVDPLDPSRAIFRVKTTEPAICAIVWGESEELGNFNNSLNMNGTGIVDHDVFLPGALPGETYYYRLQGSTADGTLYQSELATFTVPEVEGTAAPGGETTLQTGPNLALDASIDAVSSEFSAAWGGANAIDGDLDTEWSTAGDGGDASISIDLGTAQAIGAVEFVTRSMADGTAITTTYFVTVDDDERFGPFDAASPAVARVHELIAEGRVLTFEAEDTTGGNTGAVEIRIFAPGG